MQLPNTTHFFFCIARTRKQVGAFRMEPIGYRSLMAFDPLLKFRLCCD